MLIIKIGGGKTINWDFIAEDLAHIIKKQNVVLVHGANAVRDEIAKKMGHSTKTIISPSGISSVYTDKIAIDIFLMSYAGYANKHIVATLQRHGINAIGLSGIDGRLWEGKRKKVVYTKEGKKTKLITDNLTGRVENINTSLVNLLVVNNFIPVVCPLAISDENEILNTDGDAATVQMAAALSATEIVYLFEMSGFLREYPDKKTLISKINHKDIDEILLYAEGRMKKKILGVKKAFEMGIKKIYFGDGRVKNPITNALNGAGTIIQ